jgi:type IV pilus assembly protein PilE
MKFLFGRKAFTLIELIAVVIIVAIVAAFAIPNYTKTIERAHLKDATGNLIAVHSAQQVRFSEQGKYWPDSAITVDLASINTNLKLNIIAQSMTYTCTGTALGTTFICDAVRSGSAPYTVRATQAVLSVTNPQCISEASCP